MLIIQDGRRLDKWILFSVYCPWPCSGSSMGRFSITSTPSPCLDSSALCLAIIYNWPMWYWKRKEGNKKALSYILKHFFVIFFFLPRQPKEALRCDILSTTWLFRFSVFQSFCSFINVTHKRNQFTVIQECRICTATAGVTSNGGRNFDRMGILTFVLKK